MHGIISCGNRRAAKVVLLRSVLSPVCCLLTGLLFRLKGDVLKIFILQGALPQAVSSFVVCACSSLVSALLACADALSCYLLPTVKEFKIQPEVFSTSTTLTTALCLPVMCIWFAIVSGIF